MAIVVIIVLAYFLSFSFTNGNALYQGQTLNEPENVNVTSSDEAGYDQTNVPSDNQTMTAANGINDTNANETAAKIPNNISQQQPQPLQQQEPSTLQQEEPPLQSPPSLQQQPPLPPVMRPLPQQPLYCYYPNYNPQCVSGQTIPISIVPNAATKLNLAFQPGLLYVNIGTRITWTNYDSQIHTITSGSTGSPSSGQIFDSGLLSPGATFSLTFVQPGIFSYHCTLHPQMVGTVVVS